MPGAKDIQRRIKSVNNSKKITKAMEMVASSKMRRAMAGVLATRPYAGLAWQTILHIASRTNVESHSLLAQPGVIENIGVVLITSNRGLCGSFNQQIIKVALDYVKQEELEYQQRPIKPGWLRTKPDLKIEFIVIGEKGARAMFQFNQSVVADFPKADVLNEVIEIRPLVKMVTKDYLAGKYDKVVLIYTDFISALKQVTRVKQILPIEPKMDEMLGQVGKGSEAEKGVGSEGEIEYLFEPKAMVILDELLPRLLEVQIYQALLESNASEHSARMIAMRNASDAAGDMVDELTLSYNQARQAAITAEIAEIASGKAVLE